MCEFTSTVVSNRICSGAHTEHKGSVGSALVSGDALKMHRNPEWLS